MITIGARKDGARNQDKRAFRLTKSWKGHGIGVRRAFSFRDLIEFGPMGHKAELLALIDEQLAQKQASLLESEDSVLLPASSSKAVEKHEDSVLGEHSAKPGEVAQSDVVHNGPLDTAHRKGAKMWWKPVTGAYPRHAGVFLAVTVLGTETHGGVRAPTKNPIAGRALDVTERESTPSAQAVCLQKACCIDSKTLGTRRENAS